MAGPYGRCGTWVENRKEGGGGRAHAAAAVDAVFAVEAAPSTASLLQALVDLGMPAGIALIYLEKHSALRRFGDVWVRWAGDTAANRAEAALHVLGAPATAEAILATINSDGGTSLKRVNAVLSMDYRFVRASRTTWGLRAWGIPEYAGIAHAIGDAIDASGGKATVKEVMSDLRARYPDITESSIRSYVSTLEFITKRGVVRRRTKADAMAPGSTAQHDPRRIPQRSQRDPCSDPSNLRAAPRLGTDPAPGGGHRCQGCPPARNEHSPAHTARSRCPGSWHRHQGPTSDPCVPTPSRSRQPPATCWCWLSGWTTPRWR